VRRSNTRNAPPSVAKESVPTPLNLMGKRFKLTGHNKMKYQSQDFHKLASPKGFLPDLAEGIRTIPAVQALLDQRAERYPAARRV
jgi:hypothetical protein